MFSRYLLVCVTAGALVVAGSSCSGGKKEGDLKVKSGLAARAGDFKITQEQMLRRYEELPDNQKKEFKGRDGQAKFTEHLIEEHLIYQAALDAKLDKSEEMEERIRWATMNMLVAEYFTKNIAEKVAVDEKEIVAYFQEHPEEFMKPPVVRAQYLFTVDSLKAVKWLNRIAAGEKLSKIANEESEDPVTAPSSGDLGYFNPGGYIRGVGNSAIISAAAEKLEVGKTSDVIRFEKGFAILRVTERNPQVNQTLDEARRTIESKLRVQKTEALYSKLVGELKDKYGADNYVKEMLDKTTRTAEELWEIAQLEQDPRQRIQYYRDIVTMYPDHKNAPQALFMVGFTYAEELRDAVQARRTFDELKLKYPQSEMIQSAEYMIENLDTAHPKLESFETMQKRMEEDKARQTEGAK